MFFLRFDKNCQNCCQGWWSRLVAKVVVKFVFKIVEFASTSASCVSFFYIFGWVLGGTFRLIISPLITSFPPSFSTCQTRFSLLVSVFSLTIHFIFCCTFIGFVFSFYCLFFFVSYVADLFDRRSCAGAFSSFVYLIICLLICLIICLFVCLIICLFACLIICFFVCLIICLIIWEKWLLGSALQGDWVLDVVGRWLLIHLDYPQPGGRFHQLSG